MKRFTSPSLLHALTLFFALALIGCSNSIHKQVKASLPGYEGDTAIILPDAAIFVFKPEPRSEWFWHQDKTPFNAGEYSFKVEFKLDNAQYSCGFSLFKHPFAKADSGSFKELIRAGQIDLWKTGNVSRKSLEGNRELVAVSRTREEYVRLRTVVNDNSLAIILKEKNIVEQFNQARPDSILFLQNLPSTYPKRKAVKVTYRSNISRDEK